MIYEQILHARKQGKKLISLLIDPDKTGGAHLNNILERANKHGVDYIFLGGSHISASFEACAKTIKQESQIPVVLFPGSMLQLSSDADALLLLSLISGRNPEFLIGHHVVAAPSIRQSGLEVMPCAYMLIEGGQLSSVEYISNTRPIPARKTSIAVATAMAGQMLGMKLTYLEAGSGAHEPVPPEMIRAVRENTDIPLIVGGGIRSEQQTRVACESGADLIVVGTAFEQQAELLSAIAGAVKA